jgi:hypothetical protein
MMVSDRESHKIKYVQLRGPQRLGEYYFLPDFHGARRVTSVSACAGSTGHQNLVVAHENTLRSLLCGTPRSRFKRWVTRGM